MKLKFTGAREYLRSSLWFIPAVFVVAAFGLAESALRIDRELDQEGTNWFLFGGGVEGARSVVSTIASSMLTFTGLVFSITMLVLQLASSQLSPRAMRTFLRDRANQIVLGTFIGTFLYALLVLRRITDDAGAEQFVPALSVWVALMLVLLSVGLFVFYIDHMAQSIRPVTVMERVTRETEQAIARLYPGIGGDEVSGDPMVGPVSAVVLAPRSGVVTGVDEERIAEVAVAASCVIELKPAVGDFVREGSSFFEIRGNWDGSEDGSLQSAVGLGSERTMRQDVAFGLRQLVDVAVRALSPGINDPTTAVQALDHVHHILGRLLSCAMPSPRQDLDGDAAVIVPRPNWPGYVALACDEIRRAGSGQVQIQRRMRAMLVDLLSAAPLERRKSLELQLSLLNADLQSEFEPEEQIRVAQGSPQGHGAA